MPAWGAFNALLLSTSIPVATVRYLPFIQSSPNELLTVYTALVTLVSVAEKLGQKYIFIAADLAIYSRAQKILWNNPPLLAGKATMIIEGMHLTMAYLASIGKLYGDGGLLSLLTQSDVYAHAICRQILQGKHFARGVRAMKLAQEAMLVVFHTVATLGVLSAAKCL